MFGTLGLAPAGGWAFRVGEAAYNGVAFRLAGKSASLLRRLARRPGEPVTLAQLRADVWADYPAEDSTVRGQLSRLRSLLRDLLTLPAASDPIPAVGDSTHRLTLT